MIMSVQMDLKNEMERQKLTQLCASDDLNESHNLSIADIVSLKREILQVKQVNVLLNKRLSKIKEHCVQVESECKSPGNCSNCEHIRENLLKLKENLRDTDLSPHDLIEENEQIHRENMIRVKTAVCFQTSEIYRDLESLDATIQRVELPRLSTSNASDQNLDFLGTATAEDQQRIPAGMDGFEKERIDEDSVPGASLATNKKTHWRADGVQKDIANHDLPNASGVHISAEDSSEEGVSTSHTTKPEGSVCYSNDALISEFLREIGVVPEKLLKARKLLNDTKNKFSLIASENAKLRTTLYELDDHAKVTRLQLDINKRHSFNPNHISA